MIKLYPKFKKQHVVEIFGNASGAAKALKIKPSSFSEWPEELNDSLMDRVVGAVFRENKRRQYYDVMEKHGVDFVSIK